MKMLKISEKQFILLLFFLALASKLPLALLHLSPPGMPQDFPAYIDMGKGFLSGTLYETPETQLGKYGPLFAALIGYWIQLFTADYLLLKMPMILFNSFGAVIFFFTLKKIVAQSTARYFSVLYAFSYLPMVSAGMLGNDDELFLLFQIVSFYFLLDKKLSFSAVFLAIAMGFKLIPVLILPAVLLYIYRQHNPLKSISYLVTFSGTFFMILSLSYLSGVKHVLYPYLAGEWLWIDGMGVIGLIRQGYLISTYILSPSLLYEKTFIVSLAKVTPVLMGTVFFFYIGYIIRFMSENNLNDLLRNALLSIVIFLIFSPMFYSLYILWVLPFLFLICSKTCKKEPRFNKEALFGIILIYIGALIAASLRWTDITMGLLILYWVSIGITPLGTYLTLKQTKTKFIKPFVGITLAVVMFDYFIIIPLNLFGYLFKALLPSLFMVSSAGLQKSLANTAAYPLINNNMLELIFFYVFFLITILLMLFYLSKLITVLHTQRNRSISPSFLQALRTLLVALHTQRKRSLKKNS